MLSKGPARLSQVCVGFGAVKSISLSQSLQWSYEFIDQASVIDEGRYALCERCVLGRWRGISFGDNGLGVLARGVLQALQVRKKTKKGAPGQSGAFGNLFGRRNVGAFLKQSEVRLD